MPSDIYELERDLGLYATVTISIGTMVGSGIFVLPGLAAKMAGPAVILAYPLAGLVVLPAALSKAEMATAMPESGGTYLFVDRAMGPLPGTIAGLDAYLPLFAPLPTKPVALALGVALLVVSLVGVEQTLRARIDRDGRGEEGRPRDREPPRFTSSRVACPTGGLHLKAVTTIPRSQ